MDPQDYNHTFVCNFCQRSVRGSEMNSIPIEEIGGNYTVEDRCPFCDCIMFTRGGVWAEEI
jgi:hypothetical protein